MGEKTDLINTIVANAHGLPEALEGEVSEKLVGICEVKLLIFTTLICLHISD
jgi:dynactin 1